MNKAETHLRLFEHINQYLTLNEGDKKIIEEYTLFQSFKNKENILEEGQICRNYYFVVQGCLRMFFINDKGNEQTTYFALDNWWLTDYFSFMNSMPSLYYIQAVGKTSVLKVSSEEFNCLLEKVPSLERYFRIIMQRANAASQERIRLLYSLSKEELYLHFSSYFPQFVQKVPQYMIASFLGLTPEYVSEIRKKKG
jgi:Cyclic nucleotide-binding domain.